MMSANLVFVVQIATANLVDACTGDEHLGRAHPHKMERNAPCDGPPSHKYRAGAGRDEMACHAAGQKEHGTSNYRHPVFLQRKDLALEAALSTVGCSAWGRTLPPMTHSKQ
jgi:hypothetical protein